MIAAYVESVLRADVGLRILAWRSMLGRAHRIRQAAEHVAGRA